MRRRKENEKRQDREGDHAQEGGARPCVMKKCRRCGDLRSCQERILCLSGTLHHQLDECRIFPQLGCEVSGLPSCFPVVLAGRCFAFSVTWETRRESSARARGDVIWFRRALTGREGAPTKSVNLLNKWSCCKHCRAPGRTNACTTRQNENMEVACDSMIEELSDE